MELDKEKIKRYARQIILSEIGSVGQKKLLDSKVLIIGIGGLGSACATYLAAAGVGTIGIVDFDIVSIENLQRQIIHSEKFINEPKIESAKNRINELNSDVKIISYNNKITSKNILEIISNYDIIADCTDNFPTRYLINDSCVLANKPFVHAAVIQFYGQAMTIIPKKFACYRCLNPSPPPEGLMQSCEQLGVIGTIVGIMGVIQANEIIKYILNIGELLTGKFLFIDALNLTFEKIVIEKNIKCPVCGENPSITDLTQNEEFYHSL